MQKRAGGHRRATTVEVPVVDYRREHNAGVPHVVGAVLQFAEAGL
jgi:hypothetical protein